MNTLVAEAIIGVLLLIVAALGGYMYATHVGDVALGTAQADLAVCTGAAEAKQSALSDVRKQLDDQRARHDQMLRDAEAALAGRDAAIESLQAEAATLRLAITGTAHDDANCAALDRMPVCAPVDRRLWPDQASAHGRHAP